MTMLHTAVVVFLIFSFSLYLPISSYEFDYGGFRFFPKYIDDSSTDYSDSYEDYQSPLEIFVEGRGLIKINDDWCANRRDLERHFINYKQCGIYHKCNGTKDRFVLLTARCSGDKSFNEESQSCVENPPCSKMVHPDNQGKYLCEMDYDHRSYDPKNCSNYYVCHDTGSYYTLEFKTCPQLGYFVDEDGLCSTDKMYKDACAQYFAPDLDGWCNKAENVYQQSPDTCRQYYTCSGGYVSTKTCPTGTKYNRNPTNPGCVPGSCDVSETKELPPDWGCLSNELANTHPTDCRKFYTCYPCNRSRYCYFATICPLGQFFDEDRRECLPSSDCPQSRPMTFNNCTSYKHAVWNDIVSKWVDRTLSCSRFQSFSKAEGKCVNTTKCSHKWESVPPKGSCNFEGREHECFHSGDPEAQRRSCPSEGYERYIDYLKDGFAPCYWTFLCRSCRGGSKDGSTRFSNCKNELKSGKPFEIYAKNPSSSSNLSCGWCAQPKGATCYV